MVGETFRGSRSERQEGSYDVRDGERLALADRPMISEAHRDLYRRHYENCEIRSRPHSWQGEVEAIAVGLGCGSVLDYGCGPAHALSAFSGLSVTDYDPAVSGVDERPEQHQLVVCNHVLEHVEPSRVLDVLQDLKALATKALYLAVSCEPSTKKLPDGTPWHSTVKSPEEWLEIFRPMFTGFEVLKADDKEVRILWKAS